MERDEVLGKKQFALEDVWCWLRKCGMSFTAAYFLLIPTSVLCLKSVICMCFLCAMHVFHA